MQDNYVRGPGLLEVLIQRTQSTSAVHIIYLERQEALKNGTNLEWNTGHTDVLN